MLRFLLLFLSFESHILIQAFARRALTKINELSQLESMSVAGQSPETESIFREATLRV